jgi:hypothetical protein
MTGLALALVAGAGPVGLSAQDIPYTAADGKSWDASTLGNHRVVVDVPAAGAAARALIPWRRRDSAPERKAVIVTDASGQRIRNVHRGRIDRERGEIWFEPVSGPGRYYAYYLPQRSGGRSNYPTVTYVEPEVTADVAWAEAAQGGAAVEARVVEFQSIDAFHSFFPMEVVATADEVRALVAKHPGASHLVFTEDRMHPIRMRTDVPKRWIDAGVSHPMDGSARRGEFFAFQFGVFALEDVKDVQVRFSDLRSEGGRVLDAGRLSCLNTHGVGWTGTPFVARVDVPRGTVQAIWCGVDVPTSAASGVYRGDATVTAEGRAATRVPISLTVSSEVVADGGADEPEKQTRLKWLNSTLAQENEVIPPYTPLAVEGTSVSLLGRKVTVGPLGLPARVQTFFTPEMTGLSASPTDVLASPVEFVAEVKGRGPVIWRAAGPRFVEQTPGTVRWQADARADELSLQVEAALEFDGFASYRVTVTALQDVALDDIRMVLPYAREAATFMMGLGQKGGARPSRFDWQWNVTTRNQDGAWIGSVNAGLYFSLRAENYIRPLNTNFYLQRPLELPPSWGNAGKGGVAIAEHGRTVRVDNYSGSRIMKTGQTLHYDFVLIVTPFHPLDTDFQWRTRFYHRYASVDHVRATGASVVNIHHATPINPWINYPFIAHREMKAYIDEAHARGLLVKIYNTVRELSNRAYELFPLRSLGHEVFSPGAGGGFSWLQEHLGDDYIAAWFVPEIQDAAIVNSGMSRWHNYYVEGMNWLVRTVGIDGIYLDDVAFDRTTMKRIKRVLTRDGRPGIVDFHSANQFNLRDGFINSAVLYLEHFPHVNRLWFGEYFDYERNSPEFFLTEISGIPFGLMGEMLEGGGNPWRGMLYGMTNRLPWNEASDPRPMWKTWDEFGMAGTQMIGYWSPSVPVKTGRDDVLATVYRKEGAALVAIASWAEADTTIVPAFDWKALGLDPARVTISAPEISNFQAGEALRPGQAIGVPRNRGRILVVR